MCSSEKAPESVDFDAYPIDINNFSITEATGAQHFMMVLKS